MFYVIILSSRYSTVSLQITMVREAGQKDDSPDHLITALAMVCNQKS
eukprot:COSAG02_NODE_46993_length_344_cov_1.040816_1_plen_46_part_01